MPKINSCTTLMEEEKTTIQCAKSRKGSFLLMINFVKFCTKFLILMNLIYCQILKTSMLVHFNLESNCLDLEHCTHDGKANHGFTISFAFRGLLT